MRASVQPNGAWGLLALAVPMIVSRAGLAAMGIADGIMVSRYDAKGFAGLSLAEGTIGRALDVGIALVIGGLALVPRHVARGDTVGAFLLWRRTIPVALVIGILCAIAGVFGGPLLNAAGQSSELSAAAGRLTAILGAGFPAALLAISAAVYLEGTGRAAVVAVAIAAANGLNILLNWVLINGHFGLPSMGAGGSALATTLVRCGLAIVLLMYAWRRQNARTPEDDITHAVERAQSMRAQWRMGLGTAMTVAVLVGLTACLTVFAGRLGVLPLATFAASWGLGAALALVALGLADAAGIRVAEEAGRAGDRAAAGVCRKSVGVTLMVMIPLAGLLAALASVGATVYTANDGALRQSIAATLPAVAAIVVVDCIGFVLAAGLRALKDVAWPAGIDIGVMAILVPSAAALAFGQQWGVRGLFVAMLAAGVVRAALLAVRLHVRADGAYLAVGRSPEVGA